MSDHKKNKAIAAKTFKEADQYILIAWTEDGLHIHNVISDRAFTMLGGVELAKMNILEGFKKQAEKDLAP